MIGVVRRCQRIAHHVDKVRAAVVVYYYLPTSYNSSSLTDGCWSPTRPGVFFTTSMEGIVNVWDLCFKQTAPTLMIQVQQQRNKDYSMLMLFSFYVRFVTMLSIPYGYMNRATWLLVALTQGNTTILELSSALSHLQPNEKHNINAVSPMEQWQHY